MPTLFAGTFLVICKNKRLRLLASRIHKLHTVLAYKTDSVEFMNNSQTLKNPIGLRHQRLSHVFARKFVAFDQQDRMSLFSHQCGGCRSSWATANHNAVVTSVRDHLKESLFGNIIGTASSLSLRLPISGIQTGQDIEKTVLIAYQ